VITVMIVHLFHLSYSPQYLWRLCGYEGGYEFWCCKNSCLCRNTLRLTSMDQISRENSNSFTFWSSFSGYIETETGH